MLLGEGSHGRYEKHHAEVVLGLDNKDFRKGMAERITVDVCGRWKPSHDLEPLLVV